jgi:hypothetical protein
MNQAASVPTAVSSRARRAIGAMFFTAFGGAWIALWAGSASGASLAVYVIVALITLVLFIHVYRIYALNQAALHAEQVGPEEARRSRLFHVVNAGQWLLILVLGNVLANLGRSDLVVPAAMLIIGAHFIPLGRIFDYKPHFVTGAALMATALLCPVLHSWSTVGPVGYLIAGAILWTSALWAVSSPQI